MFWESVSQSHKYGIPDGFLTQRPAFLALVLSTLFCGTFSQSQRPEDVDEAKNLSRMSKGLYRSTMQTLSILGFPRNATLCSLQAYVICHVPLIRDESERSASFVSTAFRVGQAMGLHRDPKHFGVSIAEAEARRRLWWHILHKDTLSSTASGLPPMSWNSQQHDTAMFTEMHDLQLSTEDLDAGITPYGTTEWITINKNVPILPYSLLGERSDVRQVVAVARILTTSIMRDILCRHLDVLPWTLAGIREYEDHVEQTAAQVRGRITRFETPIVSSPVTMRPTPNTEQVFEDIRRQSIHAWSLEATPQNRVFITWSSRLLNLMVEKAYCTLYHPLQKCSDTELWQQIRQTYVHALPVPSNC
ncbi:hypothetical protein LTR10_000398 [Elasticomyces elasticus]|nr:hypothetical protein LTR10_000398 [Elasticomyces elasticus]